MIVFLVLRFLFLFVKIWKLLLLTKWIIGPDKILSERNSVQWKFSQKNKKNWGKFVALPWSPNDITALIWSFFRSIVRSQKDWIPNQTLFSSQHGFLSVSKLSQLSVQGSILCYVVRIYIIILFLWLTLLHALCFLGSIICVPDLCYTLFLCYIQLPLCMAALSSTQWQKFVN